MRQGMESGAAQRQAVRNQLVDRTANNTKAEAECSDHLNDDTLRTIYCSQL